ncbi:MAG: SGNH/GDSL hydrolase family protein [Woeseiaceae bacterium]
MTAENGVLRWILLISALILASQASADEAQAPQKVLFVGNSFTYYNNSLHNRYQALRTAANGGERYGRVRTVTISGGRLPEHTSGLQQQLNGDDWDIVVLQGHSLEPISENTAEPFREAARSYASDIRADGGEPAFFMTWAYSGIPEMTQELDDAYTSIGKELDAQVVPVGRAFANARAARPELELVLPDRKHPTLAGTYLAACTFFAALHGETPLGVDYTAGLNEDNARFLQQVAWESWQEYRGD